MTPPGNISSVRGEITRYIYERSDLTYADFNKILNDEATGKEGADSLVGVAQATLDAYQAAEFWTAGGKVLNYNPITDQFGIQNGEYVL